MPKLFIYAVLFQLFAINVMFVTSANAHPHVFIETETTIIINKDFEITALRQKWTFDDQYAAFALVGMDVNKDGKYSEAELKPLAKENIESLHEHAFFTFLSKSGQDKALITPVEYLLTYKDNLMVLTFTLPLKTPIKILGSPLKLAIYDPEFYIAFLEPKDLKPVHLSNSAPKNCMFEKHRATMDQTNLVEQRLGQPMDLTNEENKGVGSMFAPSFVVSCLAP